MSKQLVVSHAGAGLSPCDIADNFADLHPPLDRGAAAAEASRCLYCYDAPCMNACPTHIDIPGFIHQIATDNALGAAQRILNENIMGGTCARACPTEILCEGACVVNKTEGAPVKIGQLQRFAVDRLLDAPSPHPFGRAPASGRRMAVVGAGPAGLSFAHRAAMLGHDVDVYEARPKAGGLNEYGLATYKMVDDFAQREVAFLLGIGGIALHSGKMLGRDIHLDDLAREYDAVFLALGLGGAARLDVPGEELSGVGDALGFISRLRQEADKSAVAVGGQVVVIGGGNTAIDAAMQARCLGAASVTLAYRRGPEQMGATAWEQDLARLNGIAIRTWAQPVAIEGDGHVERVRFAVTELVDGRLAATGETFVLPADQVLVAVGQQMVRTGLDGLRADGAKLWVDDDYQTSRPGIFAGGDCIRRGDDLTVQAVEDGKQAAVRVDARLRAKGRD
ncbi:NAD(P)-dependent oxidoreductase [Sphingopyxis sp. SE2]|uniref:NAD(P)-dependent oxidoreductase n=1 Tax=Sphingopyxis sp. SE2 TaxID=1586240 RepID=UPI0028C24265|nr:NAD(P)-dependent oxidoreductase [Sphingopyxis sp. SE2]MDT7531616.1 NAD(P)-dependent oxidoreductase [Sphingopyxis sp. SE2]